MNERLNAWRIVIYAAGLLAAFILGATWNAWHGGGLNRYELRESGIHGLAFRLDKQTGEVERVWPVKK